MAPVISSSALSSLPPSRARGDYTGFLGRKFEHMVADDPTKTLKGEVKFEPPNIKTNPPKKGSYGQPWTTLSERKGAKGVAGEYAYQTGAHQNSSFPTGTRCCNTRAITCVATFHSIQRNRSITT